MPPLPPTWMPVPTRLPWVSEPAPSLPSRPRLPRRHRADLEACVEGAAPGPPVASSGARGARERPREIVLGAVGGAAAGLRPEYGENVVVGSPRDPFRRSAIRRRPKRSVEHVYLDFLCRSTETPGSSTAVPFDVVAQAIRRGLTAERAGSGRQRLRRETGAGPRPPCGDTPRGPAEDAKKTVRVNVNFCPLCG